jgi:hypothetical protein
MRPRRALGDRGASGSPTYESRTLATHFDWVPLAARAPVWDTPLMAPSTRPSSAVLPFVDEHTITIPASSDQAWNALERFVAVSLCRTDHSISSRLLGTESPGGFEVAERVPADRLSLVGRHRFSRYQLTFELKAAPDHTTTLHARTYAAFPGLPGRLYRTLVISTGAHRVATNRLLRTVRRFAVDDGRDRGS